MTVPMSDERLAEIRDVYVDDHDVIGELLAEVERLRGKRKSNDKPTTPSTCPCGCPAADGTCSCTAKISTFAWSETIAEHIVAGVTTVTIPFDNGDDWLGEIVLDLDRARVLRDMLSGALDEDAT